MALLDLMMPSRFTKAATTVEFNHPLANARMSPEAKRIAGLALNNAKGEPKHDRDRIRLIEQNPVAFWCVRKIAWAAASVPWTVVDANDKPLDHPVNALLNAPNAKQSRTEFYQTVTASLAAAGNAYITPINSAIEESKLTALYALRSDHMTLQRPTGDDSIVTSYDYQTGAGVKQYPPNLICHIRHAWLSDPVLGHPAINTVWESSSTYTGFISLVRKILSNAGGLPGLLVFSSKTPDGMSDEQREEMQQSINRFKLDGDKFGELLMTDVGDGDVKFVPLAGTLNGLDQKATKGEAAREICLSFGVPPILYMSDDLKYSNYQEANRTFWMETVIPGYLEPIAQSLSAFLGVKVRADLTEVPALSAFNQETISLLAECDFLTIDEKRAKVGYDSVPMGNRIVVNPAAIGLDTQMASADARAVMTIDPQLLMGILQADQAAREQAASVIKAIMTPKVSPGGKPQIHAH